MTSVIERFRALDQWVAMVDSGGSAANKLLEQTLDLSELFRPDVFFNSLRQFAARELKTSMDHLRLVCSFSGPMRGVSINVKITGLQLEGCSFDGSRLTECNESSPSVLLLPPCCIGWIPRVYKKRIFVRLSKNFYHQFDIYIKTTHIITYIDKKKVLETISFKIIILVNR